MRATILASTLEKFTTFGDLLRFLRRRAGITQMELALAVGYSDAQISRLEQNLRPPDIPTIEARFVPTLDLEDEPKVIARLLDLAANVRREDAPGLGLCPYKGLTYFDEADADLFVGREELTARLTERVLSMSSMDSQSGPRFLAVIGASGSGKSSLVRAGLVPSLRWNKASADWSIHLLTPTTHPLESLAIVLTQESGSAAEAATLMDDLGRDPRSLHLFARRQLTSRSEARILLVVDQFEELFALCRSEEERSAFIDNLLSAAAEADGPVVVVITLRADFYAHCAGYLGLRKALAKQQEYIGAMSSIELRRAIEEPARRGRWELEPGLVDLLLHDVGREPGALPLLSHALLETWQRRRGRLITLSGYTSSGGVRGAIAETAEAVFTDHFSPEQKTIARRIFLRLTELGDETATGDTRRRANFNELILHPEEKQATQNVLKALADARLIITSEDTAEVAHEALIREWPTLRGWLEDNREGLRLHRHLTEASQDWAAQNREPDVLYRGARLAQAAEWAAGHADEMNDLESEFIAASLALAACEADEREAQRQRELEAAQKLAEAEHRRAAEQAHSAGQLRTRSMFLAGAFVLSVSLGLVAAYLGLQAGRASRLAASRELAAASLSSLGVDPERSMLLALEAISTTYTVEAEDALHQAIMASHVRQTIPAYQPGIPFSVVYSPDGGRLATASSDEVVKVWDLATSKIVFTTAGHYAAYSRDGRRLASIIADGTVKFWDAETGEEIPFPGQINALMRLDFSPDGSRLATLTPGNLPRIWDLQTGRELASFPGHTDYVSYAVFSPDGRRLLTASDDGTARLWDAATGKELLRLTGHPGWVWNIAFSPGGNRIATVSGNDAFLWDAASGEKLFTLAGHKNPVYEVAFTPDGARVVTGSQDRQVKVWDVLTGREVLTLAGHSGAIFSMAVSPDGSRVATGSDDGTVRIWDLAPEGEWLSYPNPGGTNLQIAFSPDGYLAAFVVDQSVKVWDITARREIHTLAGYHDFVTTLAFNPDSKQIAAAGDSTKVIVWDVLTGAMLTSWPAHTARISGLVFSRDGSRLVTASDDYKIKIWDLSNDAYPSSPPPLASTVDLPTGVTAIAISADGTRLAAGGQNGTVKIWELPSLNELVTLRGHSEAVMAVAFSPAGERVATASNDGNAKIWSTATGIELINLGSHTNSVIAVAFSPDGKRIATASRDGTAKLWDAAAGQETLTFIGDGAGLNSLAFSPDGKFLATNGDDGVRGYLLKIEDLADLARSRLTRQLTETECQKYLHQVTDACAHSLLIPTATPIPQAAKGRICQVTNTGGLYDNYFNQLIYRGVQSTAGKFGWEASVLQSVSTSDFEKNIQAFTSADCSLIVSLGQLIETTRAAAEGNPDKRYMLFDFVPDASLNNVWAQVYATDQAAFLAGYVAAALTKTGRVGTFGGVDIPQVTDFMDGFALGVAYYNDRNETNVEVLGWDVQKHVGLFVGSFCCSTEGRQMVEQLLKAGADIILPVAGQSIGWGAGMTLREHGGALFIGVDTDWTVTAPEFADVVLTSVEKRFDASVVLAAQAVVDGAFAGGVHTGTLSTGEVGISPFHNLEGLVSASIKADLEQIKAGILAGQIKTKP